MTHQTAAEIILSRADASKPNMALTSWKGNVVRKQDIFIAKNYLTDDEIDTLNRLTVLFLDSAELRVKEHLDLTLDYWRTNVDQLLGYQEKAVLKGPGSVSNEQMEKQVRAVYAEFDANRKHHAAIEADEDDLRELEELKNKRQ